MRRNRIKPVINVSRRQAERPATPQTPLEPCASPVAFGAGLPTLCLVKSPEDPGSPLKSPAPPTTPNSPSNSVSIPAPLPPPPPAASRYVFLKSPQRPLSVQSPLSFSTNSNSADSHEVARFMSALPSPGGIFPDKEKPLTPSLSPAPPQLGFSGAFASTPTAGLRDPLNSIVSNSELLKERLKKPSPCLSVSKYHALRKEFMTKGIADTPEDRKQMTMLHFAFWNPPKDKKPRSRASSVCSERSNKHAKLDLPGDKQDKKSRRSTIVVGADDGSTRDSVISTKTEPEPPVVERAPKPKVEQIGPRVKVGPDGQLIIDEQSLVVETSESQRARKQLSEMETVSGADFIVGSSGLFRNKRGTRRGTDWTEKETIKFYKALSMCGTDFSMMTTLFQHRSRAELKAKFKREDKKNPGQISAALKCQEFDADEGMTESEEEDAGKDEDEPDFVLEGHSAGKGIRKRCKPLTELEEQPTEEERGSTFPMDGNRNRKRGVAPIGPVHGWKTNQIVDDISGQEIPVKEKKPREKKKPSQRRKRSKKSIENASIDGDNPPLQPADPRRANYDKSDPLGLKRLTLPDAEIGDEVDIPVPVSRRSPTHAIKPLPFRVPGSGDPIPNPIQIDEIEIEISCQ